MGWCDRKPEKPTGDALLAQVSVLAGVVEPVITAQGLTGTLQGFALRIALDDDSLGDIVLRYASSLDNLELTLDTGPDVEPETRRVFLAKQLFVEGPHADRQAKAFAALPDALQARVRQRGANAWRAASQSPTTRRSMSTRSRSRRTSRRVDQAAVGVGGDVSTERVDTAVEWSEAARVGDGVRGDRNGLRAARTRVSDAAGDAPLAIDVGAFDGPAPGAITTGAFGDASQFSIASNTCTALAIRQVCTIVVGFAPTAAGARHVNLDLSASPGGVATIGVSGFATP